MKYMCISEIRKTLPLVEDIGFQIGVVGYHIRIEIKK